MQRVVIQAFLLIKENESKTFNEHNFGGEIESLVGKKGENAIKMQKIC